MGTSNPYLNLLQIDDKMMALQADLQNQLASGNKSAATADIQAIQSLLTSMSLVARDVNFAGSTIAPDILNAQTNLDAALTDLQNGTSAQGAAGNVGTDLQDIFHMIV